MNPLLRKGLLYTATLVVSLSAVGGNAAIYRGSVGDIAPSDFFGNGYRYGLFTYIYNYGDRTKPQFEVINYWVER